MSDRMTAQKLDMTQTFSDDGGVLPVTALRVLNGELHVGDVVTVSGVSKGKGFAGAVKRYSFAGGPKTHGQSDRHRAVGSIGQGTFPGRVWKGKKMPGRMGNQKVTLKNIEVINVEEGNVVFIKGPVPGGRNAVLSVVVTQKAPKIEDTVSSKESKEQNEN